MIYKKGQDKFMEHKSIHFYLFKYQDRNYISIPIYLKAEYLGISGHWDQRNLLHVKAEQGPI